MYGQPDKKGSIDSSISGLYSLLTDEKAMNGDVFPGSMETLASDTQRAEVRQGLYRKLHGRGIFTGSYEDFDNYFFNPYSQGNQVAALRDKTFTRDPAKEMARQRALKDASRGEYNPYGTSEVSYRPEVRGLGTNIAPIDLIDSEDTLPEPKTPAGDRPKTTRTFWGGVVSGARGIHGGAQIAVADLLKGFGGNSDDEKEAIHLINQMEKDGTLSIERVRGVRERLLKDLDSYTHNDILFSGDYSKKARQADALKLIEERMQRMGKDLSPEKRAVALDAMRSDLSEKGASEDKANPFVRWKEDAKDYMRKSEVPEGTWAELGSATASVGGAIAGQAISMIPGAAPVGQALSWASIGAQTISSGGQAIMDMEDYAAEMGVYISPEEKATIALGYMAAEFGGDALGGAVASKSISAIGKLAGGRIGQKLAVRSIAKGIAGNEGVRQSLSSLSEYAQKPLAIPLAKSAGRQIVRGAVTEGPGESLTTLMQNGALNRVWKDKEDQEAWADVARQAVKDGIYGAWAGALMGGFGAGIQSGQVAYMHRKEGLTIVQDAKNNLYEVIGSDKDQSAYLVLDRAGRQKMLPADQVVDAIHYTPEEREKSQKAYEEATEVLHTKEGVLTANQKRAGAILSASEQQQSPIYRATHPEIAEEDLNSPVALAGAKQALADVLEGQNEEVKTRVDQMALVLRDGEADPTEELTKLFSDESLSDNDRQSILDVVTAQSRLTAIERSHQEAMAHMQDALKKEWSAKSVVGDESARGSVISATITDADGNPKQVYVTGGVRVVTNEAGTVELLPTDDDAPIYVYDESVDGEEKGHIVQMDDLSSPQLVAEDYLDLVQASIDEAETAFRSEVQAAEEQTAQDSEQEDGTIRTPNGRSFPVISGEDALSEIELITSERSDEAPSLPEPIVESADFDKEFGAPVDTPISSVTVGRGAFYKMVQNGRTELSGAIKPTLTAPDYIVKDGDTFLYVKLYRNSSGDMVRNIVAVEKTNGELHYLASIHPKTDSNLKNKIKSGGLLIDHLSIRGEKGEQPQGLQSELPADLSGKGTENSEGEQFPSSLPRTREGEVDGLRLMSERPDDFIRYLGQLYGEDFVASLPLSKKGVLDLKALTPEQTLRVNEAALGKSGAVEAARQRRSQVGAERAKLEAEVKNDLGNLEKRMALRKASEEYRLYDDYVRTAEEQTRQEREAQKRAEEAALTPEERQRREEEKRQLAQEKKEREERIRLENERRRREREELERNAEGSTVREYTEDPPRQARTRGARLVNGAVVYRQEPMTVEHYADAERAFSQRPGETRVPVKRTIVEAESLQASHKEGRMNPKHFIPEAQPKDRADNGLSSTAADRIASDIRPDEITGGITAYTGAPVVNGRGEGIQGNNRTDALQTMYDGAERHAKSAERYKEYLKAHASEYGMTAEQVEAMAHPVAVDVAEVSDSEAIRLGHRGQTDLESAGTDTMNAQTVGEELNSDTDPASGQSMLVSFFNRIFNRAGANGAELSAKMDNMLNRNAEEGLKFLHENGYITDTQYKNAFETNSEGKRVVTAEAKTALKDVALYQLADVIGPRAMDIFYRLPASARNGLATFLYRDSQASFETSLAPDLGDALLVWDSLRQDPDFAGLTNFESAKIFILGKVSLFGRSELETNLGEASSLAKLLAASMQTQTEEQIADVLNQYYDLVGANETGAKTQSLMPTSQPTDTKAGASEAVYGRVYEVPSGREKHYRFRRDVAEDFRARRDVAEDFRARRDALADRITEERRKRAAAADMARTFGVPLKLHEDMSTLPEEVRAGFDETHFVKGWFYKGDDAVHIYLPANVDADDVRATFLHEAVGHYGCRELLGEVGYNQVLDNLANKLGEEEVLRAMSEYCNGSQDLTDLGQVRIAMDEWIAHRAESGITKKTVWESIKDFFRNVFGLSGKQIDQSAEMMADDLLRRSAENLQKRAERQQATATERAEVKSEVRFRARKANGEEVDLPGVSYSDVRDHYGHRFVKASDGSIDFGEIGEETGLTPGKIRLSEGSQSEDTGYGLLHMEREGRKEQILKAGFSSAINFAEYVAKNYTAIFKGKVRPSGKPTYILQAPTSKNNILYVELFPEDGYWDINSGGPFSFTYTKNKEIVWSLPALGHTIVTGGMELSAQQTGDSRSGNSPQTISLDDKGTESSVYNQKDESEKRFRRAEREGDVSGAAEAASDFMRNATPKNSTVDDVLRFLRVYHNSPHLLKKADGTFVDLETGERLGFDHRFIGSGEGFQAHGWGSYFSVKDLEGYGQTERLIPYEGMPEMTISKDDLSRYTDEQKRWAEMILDLYNDGEGDVGNTFISPLERLYGDRSAFDELYDSQEDANTRWDDFVDFYKNRIEEDVRPFHNKYVVEIPNLSDSNYLEEDAPLSEKQASAIKQTMMEKSGSEYDETFYSDFANSHPDWNTLSGGNLYKTLSDYLLKEYTDSHSQAAQWTSEMLNEAGFIGIHYNGQRDGECYVIFNENDARITAHYRFRREEREKIRKDAIEDGTWMKAPNGENSNLSERDWVTVRTKAFKDWFGDWETYDDGLLDENYEPRVFYHRSPKVFTEFSRDAIGSKTDPGFLGRGFYFFSDPQEGDGYGNNTYPVFLKMKYPYYAENEDVSMLAEAYSSKASSDFTERLKSEGYDGVIYTGDLREELMVFDPEQIKSAIGNTGTFDGTNPDIRYRKGHLAGVHTLTTDNLRHALKMGGLANPSIAVYDTERGLPTRTFGEVALIAPRDLVDAKTGRHKGTYNRDAWTPTYPQVSYELTKNGEDALRSLSDKVRNLGDVASARLLMNEANQSDLSPATLETRLRANEGVRKLYESEHVGEDFDSYVSSLAKSIEMEDFLFAGQRADGSWKKVPHTLDNVSKLMKRERAEGSKAYPFAYALSKLGGRYRSLSAIRKGEDLLSGKDQAKWEATREEFANLANELQGEAKSLFDIRGEEHLAALLADGENLFGRPLTVTEEARVSALREQMKALPTDYFETKVDRPVGLSEFVEAVVPEGTSPELMAELEKSGLKVSSYDSTKEGSMNEAVLSAMDRADATDRGVRFRTGEQNIEEVNRKFNEELEKFVAGELSPKHIFNLGYPSPILISAGIIDAPIQITLRILKRKSTSAKHVFDPLSLQGLPKALQHPIAITEYKEDGNHVNVIVELSHNGENLLVGIKAAVRNRSQVNDIKGLFYKSTTGWLRWIKEGKALYVNNEKVQEIIETRRTNPASQSQSFLNSATNITNNPEDTKTEGQGSTDPMHRFRRAESAGDASGAAEAVSDFVRNATPKNTSVDDVLRFLRVYHNSPHLLKKADGSFVDPETGERLGFDHRFMGSGEGAQAHGWGSYFSVKDLTDYASPYDPNVYHGVRITHNDTYVISNGGDAETSRQLFTAIFECCTIPEVAENENTLKRAVIETVSRHFREQNQWAKKTKRLLDAIEDNEPWAVSATNSARGGIITDPKTGYRYYTSHSTDGELIETYKKAKGLADSFNKVLSFIERNPDFVSHCAPKVARHKYAVEVPDPSIYEYLNEEEHLSDKTKHLLRKAMEEDPFPLEGIDEEVLFEMSGRDLYRSITKQFISHGNPDQKTSIGAKRAASEWLSRAGFVGIHYNGQRDGECYVIFNEKDAKITDHYRFRRTSNAERLEIERKAKADGSWLLAPDGTPTTLSKDGWIASKSSDFRAEYGDWEKARNAKWLISDEYVSEMGYFEFPHVGDTLIEDIAAYYLEKEEGHIERPGIGDILLDEKSVKNSYYHGVGANKITAFAIVPDVLKQGVQIDEQEKWKGRGYNTVMIAAPVSIEGEGYVCSVIVKQTTKNRLYVHELYLQKNLQESTSSPGGRGQDAITSRLDSSLHPNLIANVLKEYVSHKDDLPESFYQANGEPKREIVEEYLRAEDEKEIRYRRVKADPMNAISPINPQWDGEWYSSEDLTGKSTADLLDLPAAPVVPEKRPTQSVAEYAETMSRHYADPRVRFRTGAHKESLRAPQPPRITDGMSLYEVAQLQHEYNRNYRDFSEESMRRMGALDKRPEKFIRSQIDVARPVELFVEEMKRLGLEVSPEENMYWSLMLQSSKELNMRKREVEPMFERYAETIREMNLDGSLEKVPSVSYVYMKDPNVKKSKSVVKDANGYEKASLYLQAKDIDECKKLGLPYRGEKGFEDLVTNKETGKKISPEEYISLFENAVGKARAEGLCDQIRTISNWSTQKLYEAGLLTEDRYRELTRGSRRYYVPQRGFKITEETDRRAYELAELKAEGRQSLSADPVANLQAICNTTVIRAIRNRDLLDFYRWCKKNEQELYHRGVLEMGESYYRRTDEVDDKGRRVYLQSKKAPTLEEMRADNQTRREMAKIRMEKAALREKADRGLISSYTFEAKTKELDDRLKAKEDELIVKYRDPNLSLDDTDKTAKKDERVVRVYENGEERIIALSEDYSGKAVADALNNRSIGRYVDSDNLIAKIFRGWGTITRTLSSLRTQYSWAFAGKNAVRDMKAAVAANMGDFGWAYTQQFLRNVPKVQRAVWEYVWKDNFGDVGDLKSEYGRYMKEFFEDGAATGYSFLEPFNILHKNLKGIAEPTTWNNIVYGQKGEKKSLYAAMRLCAVLSEGSELSTRFAEYVTSRERGFSRKEAAIHAKEVTVNFNRHGAMSPYFNTLFGFWNASVQGAYRWYRIPLIFMAKVSAQLFVTGMLQAYLYLSDDDDKEFTEWDLMTNICIGDFRLPIPQNLRAFNGAGLQFMLACMGKKDWETAVIDAAQFMAGEYLPSEAASLLNAVEWDETRGTLKDGEKQVYRDIAPTAISPVVDVLTNRNFMGQPVYKMPYVRSQDDNVAHWSLGKKRTKQVYKDFAEWQWKMRGGSTERNDLMSRKGTNQLSNSKLNNPSVIEHLVEGYGGGPISGLADIGTWVEFASTGDVKELKKLQMVAPFLRQERDYTATDVKYWELTDLYRSRQQTMSNLRKAKEGEDLERYKEMTKRVSELAPRMTGEQLTEKIWEDGTQDEKLYVTWLETKALLKQIDKGTVTKEEVAPTIDRLTEQFRELR